MLQKIGHFLVALGAYYLAAQLGLSLAIPPGFASAVWPAAGIALACVLMLRPLPSLLGTGMASFLVNLSISSGHYSHINLGSILPALCISTGSMLQLLLAYWVFKRFIGLAQPLDAPRRIIKFTGVVVMLSSVISSTVGSSTLYLNGFINAERVPLTWLTWWVGDAFGILLFTPLLLNIFLYHQNFGLVRKLQIVIPTLVMFIATWVIFNISLNNNQSEEQKTAHHIIHGLANDVIQHFATAEHKLNTYTAFFRASERVSFEEFEQFSAIIINLDDVFSSIGWTEIIPHAARATTEQRYQQMGYTDFHFTQFTPQGDLQIATPQSEYYPVLYIYPLAQNRRAFGLNLGSNPARKTALLTALELQRPVSTAPIVLAQTYKQEKAVILYLPIFKPPLEHPNLMANGPFLGFVSGILRVDGILGSTMADIKHGGLSLNIIDITDPQKPDVLLNDSNPMRAGFNAQTYTTTFGERRYQIEIYPNQNYPLAALNWTSWLIITAGVFVAAMLQLFILMISGSYAHVRNEVERKTQDLTLAVEKANFANQAKTRFFANMSHELRTPLNAIIGFINLTLKTNLTAQQRDFLQKAELSSGTLLALINQSLDYAKIESGHFILENSEFSLSKLLQKINAQFSLKASEKNINFSIAYPNPVPDLFNADALRIEQILLNLLSNAFKFTEHGSIKLLIHYQTDTEALVFIIRDTGIGVSPENMAHLFEAFRQAESSTSRRFGGTGLGLNISKELAQLMGGGIYINSEPGKGSEFTVQLHLPVAGEKTLDNNALQAVLQFNTDLTVGKNTISSAGTALNLPLAGVHILLAEDIEINQELAKALLEGMGASVAIADNGKIVLHMLQTQPLPDVLLLDIQMPEMDGYETCEILRRDARYQHLPIIAMTANAMRTDIEKCLSLGMQGHIAKPIDEQQMLSTILEKLPADKK